MNEDAPKEANTHATFKHNIPTHNATKFSYMTTPNNNTSLKLYIIFVIGLFFIDPLVVSDLIFQLTWCTK